MKRFVRLSNVDDDKKSLFVYVYNIRYDYICTIEKEYLLKKLKVSQIKKFNRLNTDDGMEVNLIISESSLMLRNRWGYREVQ